MEWKVRYIDYPAQFHAMEGDIMGTIKDVLSRGDLMMRSQLEDFEDSLARFVGVKHAIGVSNGTDALHLSVRAAGIGPGDEVITVSHTFVATAAAIHHAGATPVLVDIEDDHTMAVGQVEQAITPRTRAIMPVQLNGRLCDMERLMAIADGRNIKVIEDAAQALGASHNGTLAGAFGVAGGFSFYPAKVLGAFGDAGAVVTNDDEVARRVKLLRNHGITPDRDVAEWSFNCRLDNLQAAILDLKLAALPGWIERRREIARQYHEALSDIDEVAPPPPPLEEGSYFDVYQNYEIEAERRDALRDFLTNNGVETLLPWGGKGVHQFANLGLAQFDLPRTEKLFKRVIMLPMYPELKDDEVEYVAETIRRFYRG